MGTECKSRASICAWAWGEEGVGREYTGYQGGNIERNLRRKEEEASL